MMTRDLFTQIYVNYFYDANFGHLIFNPVPPLLRHDLEQPQLLSSVPKHDTNPLINLNSTPPPPAEATPHCCY